MSSDGLSVEVSSVAEQPAMLTLNESNLDSASSRSDKSATSGSINKGFSVDPSSKHSSPTSTVHGGELENQKSKDTIGSTEDSFVPQWRKTKRKVAKRTFFIEAALKPISGNEVERAPKKRKTSTEKGTKSVPIRKATATNVAFRKHSISHLLPSSAGASKLSSTQRASEKTEQKKAAAASKGSMKDDQRRRSKRERHMPQKLGPSEIIQEVSDRDVIFGRPNGGVTLVGNRSLLSDLVDTVAKTVDDWSTEKLNSVAVRAIDDVKNAGGRFLEWQSLSFHVHAKSTAITERLIKVLQEIRLMNEEDCFDEDAAIKVLGETTEPPIPVDASQKKHASPSSQSHASRASQGQHNGNTGGRKEDAPVTEEDATPVINSDEKIDCVDIGSLIHVFWPLDQRSYAAVVLDKDKNLAHLQYLDDGLTEWIDLARNWFEITDDTASSPPEASSEVASSTDMPAASTDDPIMNANKDSMILTVSESQF